MIEAIDKILSRLGTVLRYMAPGFILLVLLGWGNVKPLDFMDSCAESNGSSAGASLVAILIFATLSGIVIYSFYVNTIMRVTWNLIAGYHIVEANKTLKQDFGSARELLAELDLERWQRRGTANEQVASIQKELDTWGSLFNFLYCTSIAIFIAIAFGWDNWGKNAKILLFVGAFGAFITAVGSHFRFVRFEIIVVQRFRQKSANKV